jgi:hypothetical protein
MNGDIKIVNDTMNSTVNTPVAVAFLKYIKRKLKPRTTKKVVIVYNYPKINCEVKELVCLSFVLRTAL